MLSLLGAAAHALPSSYATEHISLAEAGQYANPSALGAHEAASYDYWERRTRESSLPSSPLLGASLRAVAKVEYDPSLYPGHVCEEWCNTTVQIDRDAAEAAGRVTFPSDDVADWNEKCSWDKYCASCPQCKFEWLVAGGYGNELLGQCADMCGTIASESASPTWKQATRGWDVLCNWGPCYGCEACLPKAPPSAPGTPYVDHGEDDGSSCSSADLQYSITTDKAIEGSGIARVYYKTLCDCEEACDADSACVAYVDNYTQEPPYCNLKSAESGIHDARAEKNYHGKPGASTVAPTKGAK